MPTLGTRKGEVINGFKCIGESKDNLWALFVEDDPEWKPDRPYTPPPPRKVIPSPTGGGMEASERDRYYQALLAQLPLDERDRADLHRRGFTNEEIERWQFKSVRPWQPLSGKFPKDLPGIGKRNGLCVAVDGYLCPVRDWFGRIVGLQVRSRNPQGGRYRWLSREGASPHIEGELPLAVFNVPNPTHIAIVEGTGAKPLHVALRRGAIAIGAAGGQWAGSPQYFQKALEVITATHGELPIVVYPDAGSLDNHGVMSRLKALFELLEGWGRSPTVAWWGQLAKEDGDIDEIASDARIQQLSPQEFLNVEATTRYERVRDEDWREWRRLKSLTPDETIDKPYFEYRPPQKGEILAIVSGLGTGKTEWILQTLKAMGRGAIVASPRNSLLLNICDRARSHGLYAYHYQSEVKGDELLEGMQRSRDSIVAMCPDSFLSLEPEDFEGKLLIVDEFESFRQHTLTAATHIALKRPQILERLKEGMKKAYATLVADGLLSNQSLEWLRSLSGDAPITAVKNRKIAPKQIAIIEGAIGKSGTLNPNSASGAISRVLRLPNSAKMAIATDSQRLAERLDRKLSSQGRSVLRIDSKTSSTQTVKAFLENPKAFLEARPFDVVIFTPTVEAGLDINTQDYFTHNIGIYQGVLRPHAIVQQVSRVRDRRAEIILFVPQKGLERQGISPAIKLYAKMPWLPKLGENATADIKEAVKEYILESYQNGDRPDRAIGEFLSAVFNNDCEPILKELQVELYERANLRRCVLELLDGHDLDFLSLDDGLDGSWRELGRQIKLENARDIYNAADIDIEECDRLKKEAIETGSFNWETKCQVMKAQIKHKLPGIEDYERVWDAEFIRLIEYDDRAYISKAKALYGVQNPDKIHQWEQMHWTQRFKAFSEGEQEEFDVTRYRSLWAKIRTLRDLGIEQFLTPGFTWTKDSPQVEALYRACKPIAVQRALGMSRGKDAMSWVGRLLNSLNVKTNGKRVRVGENQRIRVYSIDPSSLSNPILQAVLECLDRFYSPHEAEAVAVEAVETETVVSEAEAVKCKSVEVEPEANQPPVPDWMELIRRINDCRKRLSREAFVAIRERFGESLSTMSDLQLWQLLQELEKNSTSSPV